MFYKNRPYPMPRHDFSRIIDMENLSSATLALFLLLALVRCNEASLHHHFYRQSCPKALSIIKTTLKEAVQKDPRVAASLLRLHFHDCFVKGCDASLLLDDTANFTGEKTAAPNLNSARGFEVLDKMKSRIEKACPGVVSCADILAVTARDSVVISGGPSWGVLLGRRDARGASKSGANYNIPAPNSTHQTLETKFELVGLNTLDLVVLSGAHTIGFSRCTQFKQRLYNQNGNGQPDSTLDINYLSQLRAFCPLTGTDDNQTRPLDPTSPRKFDNHYYTNLVAGRGLLNSDQILYSTKNSKTSLLVKFYTTHTRAFFQQFAKSMIKMGNISPLTGSRGEIRKNCRRMN